jgi:hypothetical protein
VTGEAARLEGSGATFSQISAERLGESVGGGNSADAVASKRMNVMEGAA